MRMLQSSLFPFSLADSFLKFISSCLFTPPPSVRVHHTFVRQLDCFVTVCILSLNSLVSYVTFSISIHQASLFYCKVQWVLENIQYHVSTISFIQNTFAALEYLLYLFSPFFPSLKIPGNHWSFYMPLVLLFPNIIYLESYNV